MDGYMGRWSSLECEIYIFILVISENENGKWEYNAKDGGVGDAGF